MEIQISILVDPNNPQAIIRDAEKIFRYSYRNADFNNINNAFLLTKLLYDGNMPGYLACGVEYHDFAHVAAVFAAASRLLDGCELTGIELGPPWPERYSLPLCSMIPATFEKKVITVVRARNIQKSMWIVPLLSF